MLLITVTMAAVATAAPATQPRPPGLAELEGHYEYREGRTLFIVAGGERLFATLGDGKYALRAAYKDTFTNAGGDRIPFLRGDDGRIAAFQKQGRTYAQRRVDTIMLSGTGARRCTSCPRSTSSRCSPVAPSTWNRP